MIDPSETGHPDRGGTECLRILIVDDHRLFADALRASLEGQGMDVVAVATNASEAFAAVRRERPNVVLLDLGLPDMSGVQVGVKLVQERPESKVLALTALNDARAVREALRAGFHGYLTKDIPMSQLVSSIRAAVEGQVVIPHRLARAATGARSAEEQTAGLLAEQLTSREREVLGLLVAAARGDEIAKLLSVSPNTVRTHIQSILSKLGVHSRLEAATFAIRNGLVSASGRRQYS
jgi:two-component system, NarL family, nitrate/nitrite response regulator NarL